MFHQSSKQMLLGMFIALLLMTMPAYALENFKISDYEGAHQIWFEVEDFDERDPPVDQYYSVVDKDGAFGQAINRAGGAGGMIRWTFDISAARGTGGTWYFWGRVINPTTKSDFMIVEENPEDPRLPAGPPYRRPVEADGFFDEHRVFAGSGQGPPWTWYPSSHRDAHTKQLQDGENTMYILPRQGNFNVFWDVFMWTDSPDYVPSDVDYINAKVFVPNEASKPNPTKEAIDVPRDVVLSWVSGEFADTHDVYFGTVFDDVNNASRTNPLDVLASQGQTVSTYDPAGLLDMGQTYFWRIDEVNALPDTTIFKGETWSFTAEPIGYPLAGENITATASSLSNVNEGPENTINGSGLDADDLHSAENTAMWLSNTIGPQPTWIQYEFDRVYKLYQMLVWNHNSTVELAIGFGIKQATIEYSTDGTNWTTLGTTHEFARATGATGYVANTTIDLGGVAAKYVRITANSNWGGILNQYGLSEVRFLYIPVRAREPRPDSGATDADVDVVLGWRAGREAAQHDVYFSTDEQAVIDSTVGATTVTEASYGPMLLDLGQTYFWRVDEVNEAEMPTTLEGDLWNFTTSEYLVVDDFEIYNNLDPTDPNSRRIFNVWTDGYGVATNGSVVGYENPPFCEQTIVHSGNQSMPLAYSNTGGAAYSEAELPLNPPQNWTKAGATTFVLYFHGAEGNTGQLYIKVNGSKVVFDGDAGDIAKVEWNQWNIDLASLGVDLQSVTKLVIGIDGNGATGTLYVDDIRLYGQAPQPEAP